MCSISCCSSTRFSSLESLNRVEEELGDILLAIMLPIFHHGAALRTPVEQQNKDGLSYRTRMLICSSFVQDRVDCDLVDEMLELRSFLRRNSFFINVFNIFKETGHGWDVQAENCSRPK